MVSSKTTPTIASSQHVPNAFVSDSCAPGVEESHPCCRSTRRGSQCGDRTDTLGLGLASPLRSVRASLSSSTAPASSAPPKAWVRIKGGDARSEMLHPVPRTWQVLDKRGVTVSLPHPSLRRTYSYTRLAPQQHQP